MLFVATLTHSPEQCFARKEFRPEYKRWLDEMGDSAKKSGVKVHGAFVSPNEHVFYFVLESDTMDAVSEFLGPPMLTHSRGQVSAVIELAKTRSLVETFEKRRE